MESCLLLIRWVGVAAGSDGKERGSLLSHDGRDDEEDDGTAFSRELGTVIACTLVRLVREEAYGADVAAGGDVALLQSLVSCVFQ